MYGEDLRMEFDVKAAHASEPDQAFVIEADNESEAVKKVRDKGFYPFSVKVLGQSEVNNPQAQTVPPSVGVLNNHIEPILEQINQVILDKELQVKLAVTCLIADGHLLIDDIPGVGKTTFSYALARSFGLDYKRVQFTSDLLPSDILGVSVFDQAKMQFCFHPGAIFSQVLLADEINRASAKTQSALLEAMEERQVTVDGKSHSLPKPFFIIATQNPQEHLGTNPLPESQIDRFAVRIVLGYPEIGIERAIWKGQSGRSKVDQLIPLIDDLQLSELQQQVDQIHTSDALLDYLETIVIYTRKSGHYINGLSPRAALMLLKITCAWALIHGRNYATPDDMQTVLPYVAAHRLQPTRPTQTIQDTYAELLQVAIP